MSEPTLIELDSRKRAALGRLARHQRYLATAEADGTVILSPAVVISEDEASLWRKNADLAETLEAKLAHPEALVRRSSLEPDAITRD